MRLNTFYLAILLGVSSFANAKEPYSVWLKTIQQEAIDSGISANAVNVTLKNAKLLPRVIKLDRAQPEFVTPFLSYMNARVTPNQIAQGRALLSQHDAELAKVEQQYGVPATLLVAFWSMETHYGRVKGNFGLPSTLATLAYDGRRADFFKSQLFDTMRIVEAGHESVKALRGSWAGAFGHMQFMPSTFMKYAVDADRDGKINLIDSIPDTFASAANYLSKAGWIKAQPVAIEVKLPENFDYSLAQLTLKKTTVEWVLLGVTPASTTPLPVLESAAILLPQGWRGPAFLVTPNFDVVMDWNKSVKYALAVAHLADNLKADKPLLGGLDAENGALSYQQMWAFQEKLNALGFDCGAPDGFPGLKTQVAIRQYQQGNQLPQDGYASISLYERLIH